MTEVTPLDKILQQVGEDGNLAPYFSALMDTKLVVPRDSLAGNDDEDEADDEEFGTFMLENEGMQFIPVFDDVIRFKDWAEKFPEAISYVEIPGREFFDALEIHDELHVVVNHMHDSEEILYPENIQWIQDNLHNPVQ